VFLDARGAGDADPFGRARTVVLSLIAPAAAGTAAGARASSSGAGNDAGSWAAAKNSKVRLYELADAAGSRRSRPIFKELFRSGPDHAPLFTVQCRLEGPGGGDNGGSSASVVEACGQGCSLSAAQFAAAEAVLRLLEGDSPTAPSGSCTAGGGRRAASATANAADPAAGAEENPAPRAPT
jgi:dsRNA-specific ribonuclease